jgi:hypothetical protein
VGEKKIFTLLRDKIILIFPLYPEEWQDLSSSPVGSATYGCNHPELDRLN